MAGVLPEPIGSYKFSFSIQALELHGVAAPAAGDPDGGTLVASGSFRVDVPRMLARLKDRQFSDARDCLLPLVRCASASGATGFELVRKYWNLDLRFDGRPFSARELNDPFRALFEGDDPESTRGRQFAYGLLALARLGVSAVQVTSGGPGGQASLLLSKPGFEAPAIGINRGEGTLVHVRWAGWRSWWRGRHAAKRLRDAFGLCPMSVSIDRKRLMRSPEPGWYAFDSDGWRGAFRFKDEDGPSLVALYWHGTLIEALSRDLPGQPPVEAVLTGSRLSLDLSQAKVVRDSHLEAALETLISHVARRHGPAAKGAGYDV